MNGKRQPTIIDVARLSGVSKTTVARVLSGVGAVHSETRRRVEEAVRDSGYERNHLAFGLRTGRSRTLGLVIPDLSNPYWADLARGAQDKAEAEKRSLLIFSSDWDAERERRHLQALRQARVDGILINPAVTDDVTLLRQTEAPVVVLGSSGEVFPEFSSARSDVAQGVRLALDHLIGLGHRHVGLLIGRDRLGRSRFVSEARAHWQRQGLDAALLPTEEATYTVESGQAATARLFGREPGMTAVFAANDLMAVGAILAARAAGLACPGDISIMGMDGVEAGSFTDPGLTTVDKPRYDIGVEATRLLLGQIDGTGETGHAVLPCRLVERASVAAPPPAALRSVRPPASGTVRKKSA